MDIDVTAQDIHSPGATGEERSAGAVLLFGVYLVLLVWTVLWKLHTPFIGRDDMRAIKLVPFTSAEGFGASAPFEVGANLLLFAPFGIYLGLVAPRWPVWRVVALIAGSSVALEVCQFVLAVGSSDVTDVTVNTCGGLLGIGFVANVRRRAVVLRLCAVGTVLAIALIELYVGSLPHLPPPGAGNVVVGIA